MNSKLACAIESLKSELRYENEKLAESLIARIESANAAIREEFNAKIGSEIRVVSEKMDDVSRDTENKITTFNNGARGGVVVKALRYKPAGHRFDSLWCHWNFSVT